MMMDTVIYGILVWYIEAVHPGSYGLPRPWYFICQPSYWFGHNTQACPKMRRSAFQMLTADELEDAPQGQGLLAYEREPLHLTLGVTIENLKKVQSQLKPKSVLHSYLPTHPLFKHEVPAFKWQRSKTFLACKKNSGNLYEKQSFWLVTKEAHITNSVGLVYSLQK